MKNFILMTLLLIVSTTFSLAQVDMKNYPLDVQMRVWPEEIRYGDPCFLTFTATNQGPETLHLPYGWGLLRHMGGELYQGVYQGEKKILLLYGFDSFEGMMATYNINFGALCRLMKPGETVEFHTRMTWLPLPEFAYGDQAKELLQLVNQGRNEFILRYDVSCVHDNKSALRKLGSDQPLSPEDFPADEFNFRLDRREYETFWPFPGEPGRSIGRVRIDQTIRVLPRSREELDLIQAWYLELPTTADYGMWTQEHVFAHPFHVNGSPYKLDDPIPMPIPLEREKISLVAKKRTPFDEAYRAFFTSMVTRTPEVIARIERTNKLAAQILERAKQPDSTISQNMVEFIQLRGFLVDVRYAENEEAEEAAFQKLMDFVNQSQDKELWIPFIHENGLFSIRNNDHFPWQKVDQYYKRFAERFQIPKRGILE